MALLLLQCQDNGLGKLAIHNICIFFPQYIIEDKGLPYIHKFY